MRRVGLAVALAGAMGIVSCYGSGQKASSVSGGTGTQKGVTGQFYFVNIPTPPVGGIVSSDVGGINCGASAQSVSGGAYVYTYYAGASACGTSGQTQVPWAQAVTLMATPQGTNAFIGWAGDCSGTGTCTLDTATSGADKTVVAIFGPPGSGHGNFMNPAVHGPAYFGFLSGTSPLKCNVCHGANLTGLGIAPSCNDCHAQAGWTAWQSNCSFCHGAKTPATQAGYAFASHPEWSAPPDAISQRLTGTPALDRTGAHQTHLLGETPTGFSVAPAFKCETCHPVPTDLGHVSGSAARANVVLAGAGQASLPADLGTYDQASGTCTTWCHGAAASPAWSSSGMACGACHGVPPPNPHPYTGTDMTRCYGCHSETMNPDGTLNAAGGKHVDGLVQGMGHPDWTAPATHGPRFFEYLGGTGINCKSCHGATLDGGFGPSCNSCHFSAGWTASWQTNCSFCHGTRNATTQTTFYNVVAQPLLSAPPDAVSQRLTGTPDPARTGAHVAHLTGRGSATNTYFSAPVPCATCHAIPTNYVHASGQRAQVALVGSGGLPAGLGTWNQGAATCTTYCHGSTIVDIYGQTSPPPSWSAGEMGCASCHGMPSFTGQHELHVLDLSYTCYTCHSSTVNSAIVVTGNHVNGTVTITFPVAGTLWNGSQCASSCHAGGEWRPW